MKHIPYIKSYLTALSISLAQQRARQHLLQIPLEFAVEVNRLEPRKDRRHRAHPGEILLPFGAAHM
jgi:hypothetical protein